MFDQAIRQIEASEGAKIYWYFVEEETINAVRNLFMNESITEIKIMFEAPKYTRGKMVQIHSIILWKMAEKEDKIFEKISAEAYEI